MLNQLHEAQMGIVKTQTRALEMLVWVKINQDMKNFIGQFSLCNTYRDSIGKDTLTQQEIHVPSRGSEYLLCVDCYNSKYPEIVRVPTTTS